MGLFGRKKNKVKKGGVETSPVAPATTAAPPRQQQGANMVCHIVGDSKHMTRTRIDAHGRQVKQTKIIKLTEAELQQRRERGSANTPPKIAQLQQQQQQQQPVPPPTEYQPPSSPMMQQLKDPPPQQPRSNDNNMMKTPQSPIADASSSNAASSVHNITVGDESLATIEVTRELVKQFIADIWNRGEIELIPKVCHPSLRFNGHVGMDRVGHEGFARMVTTVREALTDYHCEIHSMVVETNKAFCRLRFTGKHTGNLLGYPPTGKTVAWMGASEFTCKNGKILKVWELGDVKSLEEQLMSAD
jgi:steroid delta-isomerase-like uncharacterized protein